jgi:hypothetical protein
VFVSYHGWLQVIPFRGACREKKDSRFIVEIQPVRSSNEDRYPQSRNGGSADKKGGRARPGPPALSQRSGREVPGCSVSTRGRCGKGKTGEPPGEATRKANKLSFSFQNSFLSQRSALATDEPPEGWAPPLIIRLSVADLEDRCLEELDQAVMTGRRSSE